MVLSARRQLIGMNHGDFTAAATHAITVSIQERIVEPGPRPADDFDRDVVLKTALNAAGVGFATLAGASLLFVALPLVVIVVLRDPGLLLGPEAIYFYVHELVAAIVFGIFGLAIAALLLALAARRWYRSRARIMLAERAALAGALLAIVAFFLVGVLPTLIALWNSSPVAFRDIAAAVVVLRLYTVGGSLVGAALAVAGVLLSAIPSEEFARSRMPYEYRRADAEFRIPERSTHERRA